MAGQTRDRGGVEEVGVVVEDADEPSGRLVEVDHQIELGGLDRRLERHQGEPRQLEAALRRHASGAGRRRAAAAAGSGLRGRPSSSTSRSKGRSWCERAPSTVSRERARSAGKSGSPARSPRRTRVLTKKPISPSISVRERLATGIPTGTSSCPVSRCSTRGEGGEEGHEEGRVALAGQPAQARHAPGRQLPGAAAAAAGGGRRARAVGGQLQRREAGELPPPVAELLLQHRVRAATPAARRRSRRTGPAARGAATAAPRRRRCRAGSARGRSTALSDQPSAADVVRAPERDVVLRRQAQEEGAQQGAALEVERPGRLLLGDPPRLALAAAAAGRPERSTSGLRQRRRGVDLLHGAGGGGAEGRAQRLVAAQDLGRGRRRGRRRRAGRRAAPRPSCCRPGSPAPAGAGTRAAPARRRAAAGGRGGPGASGGARRPRRPAPARLDPRRQAGDRGRLEDHPQRQLDPRRRSRTRETSWVASSEWPPSSKKLSWTPTPLEAQQVGPEGGEPLLHRRPRRHAGRARPPCRRGAGSARRSTLPLGVSGSAGSSTKAAGTM